MYDRAAHLIVAVNKENGNVYVGLDVLQLNVMRRFCRTCNNTTFNSHFIKYITCIFVYVLLLCSVISVWFLSSFIYLSVFPLICTFVILFVLYLHDFPSLPVGNCRNIFKHRPTLLSYKFVHSDVRKNSHTKQQ